MTTAVEWQPGDVVADLYEVLDVVRSGGMGLVYRVLHRGWNVELAVKVPRPALVARPGGVTDFETEAETWVGLGVHPHTVSCVYVRHLDGLPRVFAEWVDGGSLAQWVQDRRLYQDGPLAALSRILDVAIQFAWGLEHAHRHRLIHQDVKPANVMLTPDATVKVTDFGLAKARSAAGEATVPPAGASVLVGYGGMTQAYCSPEQAQAAAGESHVMLTRATDMWSWAVSVLELFVGGPPCQHGQAAAEVFEAFVADGPPDPDIPAMPAELARLLRWCFAAEPRDRPARMGELAEELVDLYPELVGVPYPRARPAAARLLADGLNNQALSMHDLGRAKRAEQLWDEALGADPHHPHAVYNRGLHRWRAGRVTDQQIVAQLEAVQVSNPGDRTAGYLLGRIHLERGDCEAALGVLGELAGPAPDDADVDEAIGLARRHARSSGLTTQLEHVGIVTAVDVSVDGRLALTGCADGSMRVWDLRSGHVLYALAGRAGYLCSVALSADARRAATAYRNGLVQVRDLQSGSCVHALQPERDDGIDRPMLVVLSVDGRIVMSASPYELRVWELPSGRCEHTFAAGRRLFKSLAVSADGLWAFLGGHDGTLSVCELATGTCLRSITADEPLCSAVTVDGFHALAGGDNGNVKLWELQSGRCLRAFEGHVGSVQAVAMSAGSGLALTASTDDTARAWELESGRCLRTLEGITCTGLGWDDGRIALSGDGRVALSGHRDPRIVRVWDLRSGSRSPWSYTRPRAVAELTDEAVRVRERLQRASRLIDEARPKAAISELRPARSIPGHERNRELLDQWKRAGRRGRRSALREAWYDRDLPGDASTSSVALDPEGRRALVSGARGAVSIYELQTGTLLQSLQPHGLGEADAHVADVLLQPLARETHYERGWSLAVSPEGRLAVSGDRWRGTIRVWELETGRRLRAGACGRHSLDMVAATPDGRLALTGSRGLSDASGAMAIELWDAQTGSILHRLGDSQPGCAVALSADGRLALSSSGGATTIRVWDVRSANCVGTLHGHDASVEAVALSADGRFAVSGGRDRTIRVWELETERCIRTLAGHGQAVHALALSADSGRLISIGADGQTSVWELDWEYEFPALTGWDERARPYLELFLGTHALLHPGSPLTPQDGELLMAMLERVGFGWLRPAGVRAELERMQADQQG